MADGQGGVIMEEFVFGKSLLLFQLLQVPEKLLFLLFRLGKIIRQDKNAVFLQRGVEPGV